MQMVILSPNLFQDFNSHWCINTFDGIWMLKWFAFKNLDILYLFKKILVDGLYNVSNGCLYFMLDGV